MGRQSMVCPRPLFTEVTRQDPKLCYPLLHRCFSHQSRAQLMCRSRHPSLNFRQLTFTLNSSPSNLLKSPYTTEFSTLLSLETPKTLRLNLENWIGHLNFSLLPIIPPTSSILTPPSTSTFLSLNFQNHQPPWSPPVPFTRNPRLFFQPYPLFYEWRQNPQKSFTFSINDTTVAYRHSQ